MKRLLITTGCALLMGTSLYAMETNQACYTLGTANNGTVPGVRLSETDDHNLIATVESVQQFHGRTYMVNSDPVRVVKFHPLYPVGPDIFEGSNFFLQTTGDTGILHAMDGQGKFLDGSVQSDPLYCELAPQRKIIEAQGELTEAAVACDLPGPAYEDIAKSRAIANAKAKCASRDMNQLTEFSVVQNCEIKPYSLTAKALFQCL